MLRVFSPAKINLFLKISGKRMDGYHELSSLLQTINLGDTIDFEPSSQDQQDILTCSDPLLALDGTNLVIKAAQLFRRKTGVKLGLKIHLNKKIPVQAGLGGGSGNAATTLWAFNQIAGNIASEKELQNWSGEIGSDIPFFFSQGTAHCSGRGELVQSLPDMSEEPCLIVKPQIGVSTPEAYKKLGLSSQTHLPSNPNFDLSSFFSHRRRFFNDLEKPVFEKSPQLKNLKEVLLECGFKTVLMAGSGSAFFCLGNGVMPLLTNVFIFSSRFLNRKSLKWYENTNV